MSTIIISGDTSGSITVQPAASGSGTLTLPSNSGSLLPSTIPAGTATTAPLTFSNGTTLTTAAAGNWEYDGRVFYVTPQSTQRGIMPGSLTYYLGSTRTLANNTTVQSIFNVGVTLSSGTIYDFEAWLVLIDPGAATTLYANFGFGGTATINDIIYETQSVWDAGGATQVDTTENTAVVNTASMTQTVVSASTVQALSYIIRGTVSINAGGTFIPQHQWSATPGQAWVVQKGSYFSLYPVGLAGANVSVGTWA